ncbi:hypothetical protein [Bacillus mycoides]|uniref:hypothetical protein n=1 Tax=Bacillus mycoides TaxID=1405 RepID=UPI00119FA763|nr:hypothetical protein [Bacillus mycoides]
MKRVIVVLVLYAVIVGIVDSSNDRVEAFDEFGDRGCEFVVVLERYKNVVVGCVWWDRFNDNRVK